MANWKDLLTKQFQILHTPTLTDTWTDSIF